MAQPTYDARGIVLRKTKLGESDLILTLLAEDGSQMRAVAKGARKPASSFAARLELYSVVDLLVARGRSLDIVKEARLVESNERLRRDIEHAAGAAPMAELLDRVTQMGLENPRLFALTRTALSSLGRVDPAQVPAVCAAHLLKTLAFAGCAQPRCVRLLRARRGGGSRKRTHGALVPGGRGGMRRMPVERGDGARPCLYGRVVPGSAELHVRRDRDSRGGSFRRVFRAAFLPAMGERARRGELEIVELPVHMRIVLKDAGGTREEEERGMYRYTPARRMLARDRISTSTATRWRVSSSSAAATAI